MIKIINNIFEKIEKRIPLFKKTKKIRSYFIFSVISTIVDLVLLFILTEFFKIFYLTSVIISYCSGIFISFYGNLKHTFENKSKKNNVHKFLDFFIISIIGLILNVIIIKVLTEDFGIWYMFSKIITLAIVFFIKYFAHKKIVFNN